jgi:plastocyanin
MEASMHRLLRALATGPVILLTVALLALPSGAGPEKISYPANWKDHVLYTTVDRHDVKQYRELYASTQAAVDAMKQGQPLPNGTILTLVQYKAQVDASGAPVKGPNGRFVKGDLIAHAVMEKRDGWGTEYPAEWRNGSWEYAVFGADTKLNTKANYKGCFECHKPHEKQDFVISLAAIRSGVAAPAYAESKAGVTIRGFAFGPAKASVEAGQNVTWTNGDDSPHQITIASTKERSPILRKGESHTRTFKTPGTYEYICGLHPQMKGAIEVK